MSDASDLARDGPNSVSGADISGPVDGMRRGRMVSMLEAGAR